ncbi:MAG: hypothetical protein HRU40_00030 [Saprospiraceae bacterium]|nr:hypothetical protein [Saprospiraceae bacterium]
MEKKDWRVKALGTVTENTVLPWNGHQILKGDIIKLVSIVDLPKKRTLSLPVPNVTALYISHSEKAWNEFKALRTKHKIDTSLKKDITFNSDEDAFNALESIATSVILAFTAIESFCNDSIPFEHKVWHEKRSKIILEKSEKKEIERTFSTEKKLNDILPEIYGVDPPKGKSPIWVSYKNLKTCRDALIHAKTHETSSVGSGKINLWDKLFKLQKPYLLAKDIFNWYLSKQEEQPDWYKKYPK